MPFSAALTFGIKLALDGVVVRQRGWLASELNRLAAKF